MTTLKITKISSKPFTGQYGATNRVGILTEEYGKEWINGFMDEISIKEGDVIFAEVERKGSYLNFKFRGKKEPLREDINPEPIYDPYLSKTSPMGSYEPSGGSENQPPEFLRPEKPNWDDINFGKCKHQFLLEAYKYYIKDTSKFNPTAVEKEAEKWATMSMRIIGEEKKEINPPY